MQTETKQEDRTRPLWKRLLFPPTPEEATRSINNRLKIMPVAIVLGLLLFLIKGPDGTPIANDPNFEIYVYGALALVMMATYAYWIVRKKGRR